MRRSVQDVSPVQAQNGRGARSPASGERRRQDLVRLPDPAVKVGEERVAGIARKQLVGAFADLYDLRATPPRLLGNGVQGHADRIGQGLVLVPDELWQVVEKRLVADDHFVVLGAVAGGDIAGKAELVGGGVALDGDREGTDRSVGELGHERHVETRIDAAGQERAVRDVAHHAQTDRFADERFRRSTYSSGWRRTASSAGSGQGLPVALERLAPGVGVDDQPMARRAA